MVTVTIVCARCARPNHGSERYCGGCRLPLGALQADAGAGNDALEPYEQPEPADPDVTRLIQDFVNRTRHEVNPSGRGWQLVVPLGLDRRQAVYIGPAGTDAEGRSGFPGLGMRSGQRPRLPQPAQAQRPDRRGALRDPSTARRGVLRRHRKSGGRRLAIHRSPGLGSPRGGAGRQSGGPVVPRPGYLLRWELASRHSRPAPGAPAYRASNVRRSIRLDSRLTARSLIR